MQNGFERKPFTRPIDSVIIQQYNPPKETEMQSELRSHQVIMVNPIKICLYPLLAPSGQ